MPVLNLSKYIAPAVYEILDSASFGKYLMAIMASKNSNVNQHVNQIFQVLSKRSDENALKYKKRFLMLFLALSEEARNFFFKDEDSIIFFNSNLTSWPSSCQLQATVFLTVLNQGALLFNEEKSLNEATFLQHLISSQDINYIMDAIIRCDEIIQNHLFVFTCFFSSHQWSVFSEKILEVLNNQSAHILIKERAINALALTAPFIKNKNKINIFLNALFNFMETRSEYESDSSWDNEDENKIQNNFKKILEGMLSSWHGELTEFFTKLKSMFLPKNRNTVLTCVAVFLRHPNAENAVLNSNFFDFILDKITEKKDVNANIEDNWATINILTHLISSVDSKSIISNISLLIKKLGLLIRSKDNPGEGGLFYAWIKINEMVFNFFFKLDLFFREKGNIDLCQEVRTAIESSEHIPDFSKKFLVASISFSCDAINDKYSEILAQLGGFFYENDYALVIASFRVLSATSGFNEHFSQSELLVSMIDGIAKIPEEILNNPRYELWLVFEEILDIISNAILYMTQNFANNNVKIDMFIATLIILSWNVMDYESAISSIFKIFKRLIPLFNDDNRLYLFSLLSEEEILHRAFMFENLENLFLALAKTIGRDSVEALCQYPLQALTKIEESKSFGEYQILVNILFGFLALPHHAMQTFFDEHKVFERLERIFNDTLGQFVEEIDQKISEKLLMILSSFSPLAPRKIDNILKMAEKSGFDGTLESLVMSFSDSVFDSAEITEKIIQEYELFNHCARYLNVLKILADLKHGHFNKAMKENTPLVNMVMNKICYSKPRRLHRNISIAEVEARDIKDRNIAMDMLISWIAQGFDLMLFLEACKENIGNSIVWNILSCMQQLRNLTMSVAPDSAVSESRIVLSLSGTSAFYYRPRNTAGKNDAPIPSLL
ncbi:MAG: hypothetical protein V4496_04810 [Pseudomonadota bacterium]